MKTKIAQYENQMNEPLQKYETVPKNANIREEFVKCGKENCNDCPHGPYFYAYWKDATIEPKNRQILALNITKKRNTFMAERFIGGLVKNHRKHPVSTDGGTWYPQAGL